METVGSKPSIRRLKGPDEHVLVMRLVVTDAELERIARFNHVEHGLVKRRRASLEDFRRFVADAISSHWEAVNESEALMRPQP